MKRLMEIAKICILIGVIIMLVRCDKLETYTETPANVIGATESTTLRTVTSHNDANCKYVAMNGSDSTGTGTAANPYRSIKFGIANLGGAFTIVTVERNGYVGDLYFDEDIGGGLNILPANSTLQVELGEKATIKKTDLVIGSSGSANRNWVDVGYGSTYWVAAGNVMTAGSIAADYLYYSTDRTTWTIINAGVMSAAKVWQFCRYIEHLGMWIAGTNASDFYTATDPTGAWTQVTGGVFAAGLLFNDIATDGNIVVMAASDDVYYSYDLSTWVAEGREGYFLKIVYASDKWILHNLTAKTLEYSTDGLNWLATNAPNLTYNRLSGSDEDVWIAPSTTNGVLWSHDAINWYYSDTTGYYHDSTYADGLFFSSIAATIGTNVSGQYSLDGKVWTTYIPTATTSVNYVGYSKGDLITCNYDAITYNGSVLARSESCVIPINGNGITINGFIIDGDLYFNGVLGNDNTGFTIKWCTLQNWNNVALGHLDTADLSTVLILGE